MSSNIFLCTVTLCFQLDIIAHFCIHDGKVRKHHIGKIIYEVVIKKKLLYTGIYIYIYPIQNQKA